MEILPKFSALEVLTIRHRKKERGCACFRRFFTYPHRRAIRVGNLYSDQQRQSEMFRQVELPPDVPGKLLLHSMPGRYEALEKVWDHVRQEAVRTIVCLAEADELRQKSSEYAQALAAGSIPCSVVCFAIPDRGVPSDQDGFRQLARDIAEWLKHGEAVLIHCAGGVGRTAMLAVAVLLALGESMTAARGAVSCAGSTMETAPQRDLVLSCVRKS
jgi:hypothetical protein